jgi:hypothetical protein
VNIKIIVLLLSIGFQASAGTIQQTLRELQNVSIGDPDTAVPLAAKPLLTELKHELRDCITEILNSNASSIDHLQSNGRLQAYLQKQMQMRGIRVTTESEDDDHPYGVIWDATLERPDNQPNLLVATTSIGIAYGSDTSLYVYRKDGLHWILMIALEENDYAEVRSAQYGLVYAVSPPDENGNFFLASVHTTAWSVSNWQGLHFKLVRPLSDPYAPEVLLDRDDNVFLGVETAYKLEATQNSFTLLFQTNSISTDLVVRPRILKFQVENNRVVRISPIAFDAQGFLEEWISEPWNEVAKWPYSDSIENAESWQTLLHHAQEIYVPSFEFVQSCAGGDRWLIGLSYDLRYGEKSPENPLPNRIYFTVRNNGRDYYLIAIDAVRPSGCPGHASPRMDYDLDVLSVKN